MQTLSPLPVAVLLDRDGVINVDSPDYILTPEQWLPIPGSLEAIAKLTQAGIAIAIASNQSALGRGMMSHETFQAIHNKMVQAIEASGGKVQHIAYCQHAPDDGCSCRKPLAGLLIECLSALSITPSIQHTIMIGDSLRDVQAALAADITPILVQSGYGDSAAILSKARTLDATIQAFPDLASAVTSLLGEQ